MYIVTSKPKRISVNSGLVHMVKLLWRSFGSVSDGETQLTEPATVRNTLSS
jgi:hypothetical protein